MDSSFGAETEPRDTNTDGGGGGLLSVSRDSYNETSGVIMNEDCVLIADRLFDDLGRVLAAFPDNQPCSIGPTPRPSSPWLPTLSSSSSSSSLISSALERTKALPKRRAARTKQRSFFVGDRNDSDEDDDGGGGGGGNNRRANDGREDEANDEEDYLEEEERGGRKQRRTMSESDRSRKSSSIYRGVSLCTKDSRWQARIRIKKEVVYLGRFESEEAAARRYDEAAREHHGNKALLNFITDKDRAVGRKSVFEQAGGKSARI